MAWSNSSKPTTGSIGSAPGDLPSRRVLRFQRACSGGGGRLARVPGRLGDGGCGTGAHRPWPSPPAGGPRTKGRRWPPITPRWCPASGRRRRMRFPRRLTTAGCTSLCNGWAGLRVGRRRPSRPRTGWARRCSWPRSWDWREPPARRRTGNAHLAATTGRAQP